MRRCVLKISISAAKSPPKIDEIVDTYDALSSTEETSKGMAAITVGDEKKGRETDFTVSVGDGSRSPRGCDTVFEQF